MHKSQEMNVAKGEGWRFCVQESWWIKREEGSERADRLRGFAVWLWENRSSRRHLGAELLVTHSVCPRCAGAGLLTITQ